MKKEYKPLISKSGAFNIDRTGLPHGYIRDMYHFLLRANWGLFLFLVGLVFVMINAIFAGLYLLDPDGIAHLGNASFAKTFVFSVQTSSTIGYGFYYPVSTWAHSLVVMESIVGIIFAALTTGLTFAKFSRPTSRILFSKNMVRGQFYKKPTLAFRLANERGNHVVDASITLAMMRWETSPEGHKMRRLYDLPLMRHSTPVFALTWTVMHPIDEDSPLHDMCEKKMLDGEVEFVITMTGVDETLSQPIHAKFSYSYDDVAWDKWFVDITKWNPDGRRTLNFHKFHDLKDSISEG